MPTFTYSPGYGGTLTLGSNSLPLTNVAVDQTRTNMDVTAFADNYTLGMAGRVTRKVTASALLSSVSEAVITALITNTAGAAATLTWTDANGTVFTMKALCESASKSYDNSGAATVQFSFCESI
jgi:hypothetical protein